MRTLYESILNADELTSNLDTESARNNYKILSALGIRQNPQSLTIKNGDTAVVNGDCSLSLYHDKNDQIVPRKIECTGRVNCGTSWRGIESIKAHTIIVTAGTKSDFADFSRRIECVNLIIKPFDNYEAWQVLNLNVKAKVIIIGEDNPRLELQNCRIVCDKLVLISRQNFNWNSGPNPWNSVRDIETIGLISGTKFKTLYLSNGQFDKKTSGFAGVSLWKVSKSKPSSQSEYTAHGSKSTDMINPKGYYIDWNVRPSKTVIKLV